MSFFKNKIDSAVDFLDQKLMYPILTSRDLITFSLQKNLVFPRLIETTGAKLIIQDLNYNPSPNTSLISFSWKGFLNTLTELSCSPSHPSLVCKPYSNSLIKNFLQDHLYQTNKFLKAYCGSTEESGKPGPDKARRVMNCSTMNKAPSARKVPPCLN